MHLKAIKVVTTVKHVTCLLAFEESVGSKVKSYNTRIPRDFEEFMFFV